MNRKGYRKKPKYIYILGILYFIVPFVTLYQFYLNTDHSFKLLKEIIFSDFYLSELFFSFTAGIAVLTVTKVGFFYFIALSIYTLGTKIYNLHYNSLFEYPFDLIVLLFWFSATLLFLFTALRIPYLNPKTRWWKQPPRYSHKMPGVLIVRSIRFPVVTLDFSKGGIFLRLDEERIVKDTELEKNLSYFPRQIGQIIDLEINTIPEGSVLFKEGKFLSRARVVWHAKEDGSPRYGLGLQFIDQSPHERKQLIRYTKLLKRLHLHLER